MMTDHEPIGYELTGDDADCGSRLNPGDASCTVGAGMSDVSLDRAREAQSQQLPKARAEAEEARALALLAEPWEAEPEPGASTRRRRKPTLKERCLPSVAAEGAFGVRLAFDILDAGDDWDRLDEVKARAYEMVDRDPVQGFLLFSSALEIVASFIVPRLLDDFEQNGDYTVRVGLAEARAKAWSDPLQKFQEAWDNFNGGEEA